MFLLECTAWAMAFGIRSTEFGVFEFNVTLTSWSIIVMCVWGVHRKIYVCLYMWRAEDSLRCSLRNHRRLVEIGSLIGLELTEHESFFVREPQGSACSYFLSIRFISTMDHHGWVGTEPWSSGLSGKHLPDWPIPTAITYNFQKKIKIC